MQNSTPLEAPSQKPNRFPWSVAVFLVLFAVTAVGVYTWYSVPRACEVDAVQTATGILVIQAKHYDDVYQVATNAFQTTLEAPVITLQQILMDTQEVSVPACLQTAKDELLTYMKIVIRALRAYAAQEPNATILDLIAQSNQHYGNFFTELAEVKKCAPFCLSNWIR